MPERTARRMASTGAGMPVQSSNEAAPCATRTSSPVDDPSARSRGGARGCRLRVRQVDQASARDPTSASTSSRSDVALTTRSASRTSGGHDPRRENCVALRQRVAEGRGRAPVAEDRRPFGGKPVEDRSVRRVALDAPVADDQRVHRRQIRLAEVAHGELVRGRDVRAGKAELGEPGHRLLDVTLANRHERVRPVEPALRERGVLHPRRERRRQRVAEQAD